MSAVKRDYTGEGGEGRVDLVKRFEFLLGHARVPENRSAEVLLWDVGRSQAAGEQGPLACGKTSAAVPATSPPR